MATLEDLEIGFGVAGLRDLRRDFDRVPSMADDAVFEAESAFDAMALGADTGDVQSDLGRVETFADAAVSDVESTFGAMTLGADTGDVRSDLSRVETFADGAVSGTESAFDGMLLDADTSRVEGSFREVPAAADRSVDGAVSKFKGMGGPIALAAGAAGAAAGAVLVHEFLDAMEDERLEDKVAATLDLTADEAEVYGEIAGRLYAGAWGDSLGQVHDAVDAVASSLGDLDPDEVEDLTVNALDLASAFDTDVDEAVNAAGVLLKTGLAEDGEDAFDLLTKSMQSVPRLMRDELIPIVEEYSQDFAALGIDGPDAFALLVDASHDGRFELDKTADAIKELTIRSSDLSDASREAYDRIGLDAETMANKIVSGGDTAREAFDQIIDGLVEIEDPADKANTAIALMGTPLEDLSVTEIPEFLDRLDDMGEGFGDAEGAADRMGKTLNDNVATDVESFKRRAGNAIDDWVGEHVIPRAAEVLDAFEADGVGGAMSRAVELWEQAQPEVDAWWTGTVTPWFENTAVPWMTWVGGAMGTGLVNGLAEAVVNLLPSVMDSISKIISGGIPGIGPQLGLDDLVPDIDVPNFDNPVARPTVTSGEPAPPPGPGPGSTPGVQEFAAGGIAKRTPGGIPSRVAEGRWDEAVLPLSPATFAQLGAAVGRNIGGRAREAVFVLDGREVARGLIDPLADEAQRVSLHTAGASPW